MLALEGVENGQGLEFPVTVPEFSEAERDSLALHWRNRIAVDAIRNHQT
jgi:hypothetical protein